MELNKVWRLDRGRVVLLFRLCPQTAIKTTAVETSSDTIEFRPNEGARFQGVGLQSYQ